jgi:oxygen-independent coproporphyrinogen-3 oxidase
MLLSLDSALDAIRLATPDTLEAYMAAAPGEAGFACTPVSEQQAWEETFFLGLRLNQGVDLNAVGRRFGAGRKEQAERIVTELLGLDLAEMVDQVVRLTNTGRLLSNEVFQRFIKPANELNDVIQAVPLASTKIQ